MSDQNARDDEIVLAVIAQSPGSGWSVFVRSRTLIRSRVNAALRRLKRAGKVRYVREMKRWERV